MKKLFSATKILKHLQTEDFERTFETELDRILQTPNDGEEATQIVAQNYVKILKSKLANVKIKTVVIDSEVPYFITVNGKPYEMDGMVKHNDLINTELLMEIQALWDTVDKKKVQSILNILISQQK